MGLRLTSEQREIFNRAAMRAAKLVERAIATGQITDLKATYVVCVDCQEKRAIQYDHRDYGRPLDVAPVCGSCNMLRGSAVLTLGGENAHAQGNNNGSETTRKDPLPDMPELNDLLSEKDEGLCVPGMREDLEAEIPKLKIKDKIMTIRVRKEEYRQWKMAAFNRNISLTQLMELAMNKEVRDGLERQAVAQAHSRVNA